MKRWKAHGEAARTEGKAKSEGKVEKGLLKIREKRQVLRTKAREKTRKEKGGEARQGWQRVRRKEAGHGRRPQRESSKETANRGGQGEDLSKGSYISVGVRFGAMRQ